MMKINLIEYFEESVQRCPQKTAVIDRDRTITFSELRGKALVLASAIGCIKRPAAVFLNKSIESVYADLAIIYSGNFYMNLDVRYLRNVSRTSWIWFAPVSSSPISILEKYR